MTHLLQGTNSRYYDPTKYVGFTKGIYHMNQGVIYRDDFYEDDLVLDTETYYQLAPTTYVSVDGTGYSSDHYSIITDWFTNVQYICTESSNPETVKIVGVAS